MAAVESRELVTPSTPFANPNAPGPRGPTRSANRRLSGISRTRDNSMLFDGKCDWHLTRDAASQKPASESNKSERRSRAPSEDRLSGSTSLDGRFEISNG